MMIKQELVKKIKEHFDLNIYETKVWIALLSKGIASAGEIAQISSVPRSRTYDVLESLEKRGFAITKIGKPVKYIAVKPTEVLEKMKSVAMNEAQEKVNNLSTLKTTSEYEELELLHKNGIAPIKTHEITASLKGRANVIARLRELVQSTDKELFLLHNAFCILLDSSLLSTGKGYMFIAFLLTLSSFRPKRRRKAFLIFSTIWRILSLVNE